MAEPPTDPEASDARRHAPPPMGGASGKLGLAEATTDWLALAAALPSAATHEEVLDALDAARNDGVSDGLG